MHSLTYSPSGEIFWFGPGGSLFGYSITSNSFVTSNAGMPGHQNDGNTVRVGPYENLYSVGVDGQFLKWSNSYDSDTKTLSYSGNFELLFKTEKPLMSLALNKYIKNSNDGKQGKIFAARGENKGMVHVFDLTNKATDSPASVLKSFEIPDGYVGNLIFHPTDPDLLLITGKQSVMFYNFKEDKVIHQLTMSADIKGADISLNGTRWAVGLMSGEVRVYSF
jgi:WD40 repeat protein